MDNVEKHNIFINISSSQTFRDTAMNIQNKFFKSYYTQYTQYSFISFTASSVSAFHFLSSRAEICNLFSHAEHTNLSQMTHGAPQNFASRKRRYETTQGRRYHIISYVPYII
jgi:hypothetical protein